jgi:hypothetical protein
VQIIGMDEKCSNKSVSELDMQANEVGRELLPTKNKIKD